MSFYFFEPSSQKNYGLLHNKPYLSNHFEKPRLVNPILKDNYSYYSYPYTTESYYNYPYYDRNIYKSFVQDLNEALQDGNKKENTTKLNNNERKDKSFTSPIDLDIPITEIVHEPSNDTYFESKISSSSSIPSEIESEKEKSLPINKTNPSGAMRKPKREENLHSNEELKYIDNLLKPKWVNHYETSTPYNPRIDITEGEKQYHIYVDLPGMTKEQIHMEIIEDHILKLSGERKFNNEENDDPTQEPPPSKERYMVVEREYGKFERSLMIPGNANSDTIQAKMENGVLEITIDKKETPKKQARTIQIQ